ncbi:MAG: FIVAR domain-containing protein, partial [Lachnospiraceae bacterium]|nr:FIVAR domain-containing protein [Lachnospiraceae bacterium]
SKEELLQNELKPYQIAIEQGIEMIMTAHILYPQLDGSKIVSNKTGEAESLPATMSEAIITDLLKEEMGFEGIVITDAMNMAGIADKWDQVQAVVVSIAAGVDMICMPCTLYNLEDLADLDAIIDGVEAAVRSGEIPMSRLDDAVTRILTVKANRGILDYNAEDFTLEEAQKTVGSNENRELEREIAAAAVTVVKNENNVLPLAITETSKVLMMCPYANEQAQMIMGWNRAKEAGLIPEGAEVKVVRFANADLAAVQEELDWADTVIINSEVSRANRMAYDHWLSAAPNAFVDYCAENGKTSVVMSVDKPYDVQLYPNADAILAVYGCKGSSVDVTESLVGGVTNSKATYGPNIIAGVEVALGTFGATGTLPVDIPKFNNEDDSYTDEIVYARGYGLTYEALVADKTQLNDLIEDAYEDYNEDDYNAATWTVFMEALAAAEEVVAKNAVTQSEVDEAYAKLDDAIASLIYASEKVDLGALITEAEKLNEEDYTAETWAVFAEKLEVAKLAMELNVSQEEVDAAYVALCSAMMKLEDAVADEPGTDEPGTDEPGTDEP